MLESLLHNPGSAQYPRYAPRARSRLSSLVCVRWSGKAEPPRYTDGGYGHPIMNIFQATASYEAWMRRCTPVVEAHLRSKHAQMRDDLFHFFRGTFYRWIQI